MVIFFSHEIKELTWAIRLPSLLFILTLAASGFNKTELWNCES